MPKPEKHVFICTMNRPAGHPRGSCGEKGCQPLAEKFFMKMQEANLFTRFAVTTTGCIGPCGVGPNILVYPEGVMYSGVTPDDIDEIINQHLLNDSPVERLLAPAEVWG